MKLGKFKTFILVFIFFLSITLSIFAEDKIETVPLINLEELSPTFEEDKDQLDQIEDKNSNIVSDAAIENEEKLNSNGKVIINLTALNKITAKTSFIKIAIGDNNFFITVNIIYL